MTTTLVALISWLRWTTHRLDEPDPADAHSWCEAPSPADHPDRWTCPVCGRTYIASGWRWNEQERVAS